MTTQTSLFDRPVAVPDDLRRAWQDRGWPEQVLHQLMELRVPRGPIDWWLKHERVSIDYVKEYALQRETLMYGTMRVREATWDDNEAVADLYANSPEEIGDWEVTVERSPYPFAQFRLQEHVNIQVLEDRGVVLAAMVHSSRNTMVGGKRTTAHISSAWRVRKELRGQGYSKLLRTAEGPACAWFGMNNYYYIRSGNFNAYKWIKALLHEDSIEGAPEREGDVPGLSVSVHHFAARPFEGSAEGVRLVRPADLRSCVGLINRTHKGQDLFRPYTVDYLEQRLNDPCWGDKPDFWQPVYGWPDYYVLEDAGKIVACAGLWDKGKNVREVWRHKTTKEERTIAATAMMDFGYAAGAEAAMLRLAGYLIGVTHQLGRSSLMAPLEQLPSLLAALEAYEPATETRALHWQAFDGDDWKISADLHRTYTDLAYW